MSARKIVVCGLFVTAVICTGVILKQRHASAAAFPCTIGAFGMQPCHGYFTGADGTTTNLNNLVNVLKPPALNNVTNAGNFESIIRNYLYGGDLQNSMGAAFIISTMLSQNGPRGGVGNGINWAKGQYNNWVNLVNHYANAPGGASYGVTWSYNIPYAQFCASVNSAYFVNIKDVAFHQSVCPVGYNEGNPVIHFHWSGGAFDVGRPCGNVEIQDSRIPQDRPPSGAIWVRCDYSIDQQVATATFSDPDGPTFGRINTGGQSYGPWGSPGPVVFTIPKSSTNPFIAQPVQLFVIDSGIVGDKQYHLVATANTQVPCVTLTCGTSSLTPTLIDPFMQFAVTVTVANSAGTAPPPGSAFMNLKIVSPGGATIYNQTRPAGWNGGASFYTFNPVGPTGGTGLYKAIWTLTIGAVTTNPPCSDTFPVVNLPYLHIWGGDAMVGSSPDGTTLGTCQTDNQAGVYSWNNLAAGGYSGAGAQYAVQAVAQIAGFASAVTTSNTPPAGLSFANKYNPADPAKLSPGTGYFGGYFGATAADCDFTKDITSNPITTDTTLPAMTIPQGTQQVIYVKDANVYISGNITYQNSGGWSSPSQIPYFKLVVVGGNLDIDRNVTQLDGLYVTEPDTIGGGGKTSDCSSGINNPDSLEKTGGAFNRCQKQLTINGAIVAQYIKLSRTFDTLGQAKSTDTLASNHAAEVFNYTPELWLPRGGTSTGNGYAAITDLPPVL